MIEISITSKLASRDLDWNRIMQGISEFMLECVRRNFLESGRVQPWPAKADGTASHLMKTGRLFNSLENTWGGDWAKVSTSGGLPYAALHQYGGIVDHPGSDKPQAFTVDGVSVFTQKTKPHPIPVPPRPYMVLTDGDIERIVMSVEGEVIKPFREGA